MKSLKALLLASFTILASENSSAQLRTWAAYNCVFEQPLLAGDHLRLKQYDDPSAKGQLGKIDFMNGSDIVETTLTKIYQFPIWNTDSYVQVWYDPSIRVDGQLSLSSTNHQFAGTYRKGSSQMPVLCSTLQ